MPSVFDSTGFMPHGHCYLWRPDVLWLNAGADGVIALAYFVIPTALVYFVAKRRDLRFNGMFLLFAAFIVACGATHAFEIWAIWRPDYVAQGALKLVTGVISITVAIALWRVMPKLLALPDHAQLEAANAALRTEVVARRAAEATAEQRGRDVAELERRQTELQLRQTEERFLRLVDGVKDYAILTLDPTGLITSWNVGAARLVGYLANEAVGRHFSLFYPADLAAAGHPNQALAAASAAGTFEATVEHVRKDGSRFLVQLSITASRGDNGELIGFTKITRDVSEARRLEAALQREADRLRSVVDHVVDGIITINERREIESWNPAARRIFGYEAAEVIGRNVRILMPEPYRAAHDDYVTNYLRTGQARIIGSGREVFGLRKDGSEFPLELAVSEWLIGDARFFTGIVRDITERKATDAEREHLHRSEREARAEAERLYQAALQSSVIKDQFLTVVSHELRTPLTAVLGYAGVLLNDDALSPEQSEALAIILRNAKAQLLLVNDLLDLSRVVSGTMELEVGTIQPDGFLANAVESVKLAARARRVEVKTELIGDLGVVLGDEGRLRQVFWNVVGNAVKFTPAGGKVVVRALRTGSMLEVKVTDTGKGIDPSFLPHVFDRFRQEDSSLTRAFGGLGVGLSIARHIVEAHGGAIAVESDGPGRGTTVTVRLPIRAVNLAPRLAVGEQAADDRSRVHTPRDPQLLAGVRIATVDDEQDARSLVAAILRRWGATVVPASSAAELQANVAVEPFDLLICDVGMPDTSGYSLLGLVRKDEHVAGRGRTPAIALTAHAAPEERGRAVAAGFDDFLTKPVLPEELVAVVAQIVGRLP